MNIVGLCRILTDAHSKMTRLSLPNAISVGEDYFEINGLQICEDCMAKQRRTADYKAEDCKAEDCSE